MLVQGESSGFGDWELCEQAANAQPAELSKRIAFFYTASLLSGAFGGLLAGGIIEGMEGLANTRGWKWLFMIEGMATVVVGATAWFILPSMFCNFPFGPR